MLHSPMPMIMTDDTLGTGGLQAVTDLPDDQTLARIEACATDLARGAGAILSGHFGTSIDVQYKDKNQRDPVTNVDKESQEFLRQSIAAQFPEHGILGEEDEEEKEGKGTLAQDYLWILDPLDGTRNFLSGLPLYACSVGVIYRGVAIVGAIFVPWPSDGGGVVLHARRGGGAFAGQEPITVFESEEPDPNALVTLPASFGGIYRFRKSMHGKIGEVRVTGSIAYELAITARGILEYCITTSPRLWDVAAGVVLVMEAGGAVYQGRRATGLRSLFTATEWAPLDALVPDWSTGKTTTLELRKWSVPLVLGNPEVVRQVTSNLRSRVPLRRRIARAVRRIKPR